MLNSITLPSPAKLNLFLHVNGRLANGYHELQTLFQFIDYSDEMSFAVRDDGNVCLNTPIDGVANNDNLIVKAARLLQQKTGCQKGIDIELVKRLPMGGGIGGGSSNAATTLMACNLLWALNLSIEALAKIGLELGADVPIFIHGKATFAEGVGEKFTDMEPPECTYLVIHPGVHVGTVDVFTHQDLPRDTPKLAPTDLDMTKVGNDCQQIVCDTHPQVEKALNWLVEYAPSRMTGTGSCVFAAFDSASHAHQALLRLPSSMTGFVCKGCNISPLHQAIKCIK
ncbi:4-(cytidine 5'-diphospho)-2-C-methyl-D-erythritol kinase [Echinimonas agarilytica]|uniref:4-diphosphocytidyl-2-C-methyl-D-erythritol kinase n=1 Tax=Echinimonas agarilytica TaxID=1215918 RepID=A0AA41W5E7_9GAMM|nr:4-(cytidine 5'-diphospho)-2-C-methyl-D-erythritol kinase [Echinimonas agarilytica]MCM2679185.1 4-(cytidine 5'-diphospho)-2-C-methyl-D-erythritol kinase [Echinimonas agarilytica]